MADITDAFVAAFPDGYPVAKPEARAIGPTLEAAIGLLATAIAGGAVAVFATKADLLASGSSANAAYVYADPASVPSRPIQGNNGLWVKDGIWTYAATFVLPATVLADLLDQQNQIAAETAARIAADDALGVLVGGAVDFGRQCATRWRHVVGTRPQTPDAGPVYGPADYRTWMVGINPPRAVRSRAAIVWRVSFDAQPARIGMRVVRRPGEVGDGASGSLIWPSAHEGDVLVQGLTWYDAADVMADPALYGSLQTITLPMAGDVGFLTPENIYFVQIYATDAASTYLAIGMQRGRTATGADPLWKRGGFSTDPTPGAGGFVPSDGGMVAHDLAEAAYIAGEDAVRTDQDPSRIASIGVPASHHTEDAGSAWAVRLPDVSIDLQPAPVGQDSTGEILLGIPKVGAPTGVRYDVLVANPDTGQTLVAFGLERTKDAIEYIPDNIGFSRLGYLRVSSSGVEYIKTSGFRHHVRRGEEADLSAHLRRNRSLLPATMRSIRRGLPVTLVVYTDSIHAISAGVTTDHYTPNGANRDVPVT